MKKEYDFSKGEQGKFFRPGAKIKLPTHPDDEGSAKPVIAKNLLSSFMIGRTISLASLSEPLICHFEH
jgi:hypothetical protein